MKPVKIARNLLIVPVAVFFMVLAVLPPVYADSSPQPPGWADFSIELEEGQTKVVSLTVENSAQISLVPLFSFVGVDSVVFFNPSAVDEGPTLISIHFAQMGVAEKEKIAPDTYRVKLVAIQADDKEFSILVYLKLGETPPSENIENEIAVLSERMDAWESLLADIENMISELAMSSDVETLGDKLALLENWVAVLDNQICVLENQPDIPENLAMLSAALDERVSLIENGLATLSADLQILKNNPSTNSDDIAALSKAVDTLIQRHGEVSTKLEGLADATAANISDTGETKSGLATVYMIVIVLAIIVIGTALQRTPGIRKMKLLGLLTERRKKHSGPPVVIPDEDAQARAKYKAEAEKREREKLGQ